MFRAMASTLAPKPQTKLPLLSGLFSFWQEKFVLWSAALVIAHERKMLLDCSDEQLLDMGISRAQADAEAKREFFDVPGDRLAMNGLLDTCTRQVN